MALTLSGSGAKIEKLVEKGHVGRPIMNFLESGFGTLS